MTSKTSPEFSRLLPVGERTAETRTFCIEAEPEERAALARRFGLASLERLCAEGTLVMEQNGLVWLQARLKADVVQNCVLTLEPVPSRIDIAFERLYSREASSAWDTFIETDGEMFLSIEDDDIPDPIVDESIDVGEAAAEQLSLELDPFPRASGAVLETADIIPADLPERNDPSIDSPFAALAPLKAKLEKRA